MVATEFQPGDRVETMSGQTRGVIVEVPDASHIDVLADTGNRYRNCLASTWRHEGPRPDHASAKPLARGDRCHIRLVIADDASSLDMPSTMSGAVLVGGRDRCYVQFDGDASRWVNRTLLHLGDGNNDL